MSRELFEALRAANVPEGNAIAVVTAFEERFNRIDARMAALEARMTVLESKMNVMIGLLIGVFLMLLGQLFFK